MHVGELVGSEDGEVINGSVLKNLKEREDIRFMTRS